MAKTTSTAMMAHVLNAAGRESFDARWRSRQRFRIELSDWRRPRLCNRRRRVRHCLLRQRPKFLHYHAHGCESSPRSNSITPTSIAISIMSKRAFARWSINSIPRACSLKSRGLKLLLLKLELELDYYIYKYSFSSRFIATSLVALRANRSISSLMLHYELI